MEQAIDRIFDAAGPENLPPFRLPPQADDSVKLTPAPGLELLAFRYPVSSYYTAWKAGQQPQWPNPQPQFVALLRRDYIVRRHELTNLQYHLLLAISRGMSLGEAVAEAVTATEENEAGNLTAAFKDWFEAWAASGFFASADQNEFEARRRRN
jgi:hypothetical protein